MHLLQRFLPLPRKLPGQPFLLQTCYLIQLGLLESPPQANPPALPLVAKHPSAGISTPVAALGKIASIGTYASNVAVALATHDESVLHGPLVSETSTYSPLRPLIFERELSLHPDKGFVNWLLHNLHYGCNIGYEGPHFPLIASNSATRLSLLSFWGSGLIPGQCLPALLFPVVWNSLMLSTRCYPVAHAKSMTSSS